MIRLLVVGLVLMTQGAWADCAPGVLDIRGADGSAARFTVEVARTPEARATGLMNRETLSTFASMLFVYDAPHEVAFWMKNTLIPLDMLFLDESGTVKHIHSNAVPLDLTPIRGGQDILLVLEINGGLAETLGLSEGAVIRHPAVPADNAAWSCQQD